MLRGYRGANLTLEWLGVPRLNEMLNLFSISTGNRIVKQVLRRWGLEAARLIRGQAVQNRQPGSQSPMTSVRKSVGYSVHALKGSSAVGGLFVAKAGASTGKAYKFDGEPGRKPNTPRGGVGISSRNIHWWLMGATGREAKKQSPVGPPRLAMSYRGRKLEEPQSRGVMNPVPAVRHVNMTSQNQLRSAAIARAEELLAREAKKLGYDVKGF